MKQSDLIKGNIYTNADSKYRKILAIEFDDEDGKWYVQYRRVGTLLIRDKIFYMDKAICRLETFSRWALLGYSEEMFIHFRRKEQSA